MTNAWLTHEFAKPGNAYRAKPFWAWNGRLDPDELRRQIRLMKQMGLGGFFMHSRIGLETRYLSREWFDCIRACVNEAKKIGMEAWLYDEDRWPSGAAGGLASKNPCHRDRCLAMRLLTKPEELVWTKTTVAVFTARIEGTTARDLVQLKRGTRPGSLSAGQTILHFQMQLGECSPWFNGGAYIDTLNPVAVREFLKVTHEAYRREIGSEFGKTVRGIFTDEPFYGWFAENPVRAPWTDALPATFRRRYGYDLVAQLPEIFFDVDGQKLSRARYHYFDCLTHLFTEAFARQIGEWCGKHNLLLCGHVLFEQQPSLQTNAVGSTMRFYEHMQMPGMDNLGQCSREYDTAKQVSSVARQFGRKWRISELYGCTGWDFPFTGHKAIGDWHVAMGINVRCPHHAWYTMAGEAKRDYPASISYQSPWWQAYPLVEDYFARVHATMTRGVEVRDLLVIHPLESAWATFHKPPGQLYWPPTEFDRILIDLRDSLLAGNIDFDYGDEEILSRHGRIRSGTFHVARARYTTVVVPPMLTMRSTTLALLKKFKASGGRVVFAGDPPQYMDALASSEVAAFAQLCHRAPAKGPELVEAVETARRVSITDGQGREIVPALHLLREDATAFYLFVCNVGHDFLKQQTDGFHEPRVEERTLVFPEIRIRGFKGCAGQPVELNPTTGAVSLAEAVRQGGGWEIRTSLPKHGSRLYVIPKRKSPGLAKPARAFKTVRALSLTQTRWPITLTDFNPLVLDRPRCQIGDNPWRGPDDVLKLDRHVWRALGIPERGGGMTQPWARPVPKNPKYIPIKMSYTFAVEVVPTGDVYLGIEHPEVFHIVLNGVSIDTTADVGWWTDQSLRRLRLAPGTLRSGANELTLEGDYSETFAGLETIYLLGNFGVVTKDTEVIMTTPPASLKLGDWCPQGLPFYSGSVVYRKQIEIQRRTGEHYFIQIPAYHGTAVRVLVDGRQAGIVAWDPHEVEITDYLGATPITVELDILSHRRNSHGPLHWKDQTPLFVGPDAFLPALKDTANDYQLAACGLMQSPKLLVRR